MIVLWEDIFTSKDFDAREILAARRSADSVALQNFVERLVDTRRYHNNYKAGALFPDLRGRLIWKTSYSFLFLYLSLSRSKSLLKRMRVLFRRTQSESKSSLYLGLLQ